MNPKPVCASSLLYLSIVAAASAQDQNWVSLSPVRPVGVVGTDEPVRFTLTAHTRTLVDRPDLLVEDDQTHRLVRWQSRAVYRTLAALSSRCRESMEIRECGRPDRIHGRDAGHRILVHPPKSPRRKWLGHSRQFQSADPLRLGIRRNNTSLQIPSCVWFSILGEFSKPSTPPGGVRRFGRLDALRDVPPVLSTRRDRHPGSDGVPYPLSGW